jgi:hypothetical protein
LLAEDGLKIGVNIRILTGPEALGMYPLHTAPYNDILFTNEGYIILHYTGGHASLAART